MEKLKRLYETDVILALIGDVDVNDNIPRSVNKIFVNGFGAPAHQWKAFKAMNPPDSDYEKLEEEHALDCTCEQCEQGRDTDGMSE